MYRDIDSTICAEHQALKQSVAITEAAHGSDHFLINAEAFHDAQIRGETTAQRDGDAWIINGQKSRWISNGTIATHAVVHVAIE